LNCIEEGFVNFYFSVFYLKEKIIDYFGDGSKWGVKIKYIEEDKPLGTAGSLGLIEEDLNSPLIILNGDVLTKLNLTSLIEFHNSRESASTICSRNYSINIPFGVIQDENCNLINLKEKPVIDLQVNAGIYVINPDLIKLIDSNEYLDMPDFIKFIKEKGNPISVFPIHEYWLDVGKKEALDIARKDWQIN
jgi:NDP-sugar pyrophosphorylase family protein